MEFLSILKLLQQPTSVAGMATLVGTVSGLLTHQLSLGQALPLIVGSIVSIALPDNSTARAAALTLSGEFAHDITQKIGEGQ